MNQETISVTRKISEGGAGDAPLWATEVVVPYEIIGITTELPCSTTLRSTTSSPLDSWRPMSGLKLGFVTDGFLAIFGTKLLLTPGPPRFMMLAGVTGAMVSSTPAKVGFFGPAKFEVIAVDVEVADFVARFRTTAKGVDNLRLGVGLFEESSSLEDALLLLTGAGNNDWEQLSHGLDRGETS